MQTVGAGCVGSIVGAASAGILNYNFNRIQYKRNRRDHFEDGMRSEMALLEVFQSDLTSLKRLHTEMSTLLNSLKEGEPLAYALPVTLNYFSVFENNAAQLGRIERSELISQLVDVYHRGKSLIDSVRMNNETVFEFRRLEAEIKQAPSEKTKAQFNLVHARMIRYAPTLKRASGDWLKEIDVTLSMIADRRAELKIPHALIVARAAEPPEAITE